MAQTTRTPKPIAPPPIPPIAPIPEVARAKGSGALPLPGVPETAEFRASSIAEGEIIFPRPAAPAAEEPLEIFSSVDVPSYHPGYLLEPAPPRRWVKPALIVLALLLGAAIISGLTLLGVGEWNRRQQVPAEPLEPSAVIAETEAPAKVVEEAEIIPPVEKPAPVVDAVVQQPVVKPIVEKAKRARSKKVEPAAVAPVPVASEPVASEPEPELELDSAGQLPISVAPEAEEPTIVTNAAAAVVASGSPRAKTIDDLLDQASGDFNREREEAESEPKKTEVTRADLKKAVAAIRGRILGCAARSGITGTAKIKFAVLPSGKVTGTGVVGYPVSSEFGGCAAKAVARLRFEPFEGRKSTFTYPVPLRW